MKRTILAVAAVAALAYPAQAIQRISDTPPQISGADSTTALLKMKKAGWKADAGRCLNAYPNVCEMNFLNQCGIIIRVTFLDQKVTAWKYLLIDGVNVRTTGHGDARSIRTLPTPPCPDEAGD